MAEGSRRYFTWKSSGTSRVVGAQSHQAGTCRMGNDPQTSVTDKYGRVHATPNLFVADASLHVTNGGFNPALTIMANGIPDWRLYRIGMEQRKPVYLIPGWHDAEKNTSHYPYCSCHGISC